MIHTIKTKDELYVYWNGQLMYKRWLKHNYGMVFCKLFGPFVPPKSKKL